MDLLDKYVGLLREQEVYFKLVKYCPEKEEWRYQLFCSVQVIGAKKTDLLFQQVYRLSGYLILDNYEIQIIDECNFLIKRY